MGAWCHAPALLQPCIEHMHGTALLQIEHARWRRSGKAQSTSLRGRAVALYHTCQGCTDDHSAGMACCGHCIARHWHERMPDCQTAPDFCVLGDQVDGEEEVSEGPGARGGMGASERVALLNQLPAHLGPPARQAVDRANGADLQVNGASEHAVTGKRAGLGLHLNSRLRVCEDRFQSCCPGTAFWSTPCSQ